MPDLKRPVGGTLWAVWALLTLTLTASAWGEEDPLRMAEDLSREVEALRGWTFRHPVEKGVYSEAELRAFIEERFAEDYSEAELSMNEAFLRQIGAIGDSVSLKDTITEVLLSQVGGLYDPTKETLYMIDREGSDYPPLVERMLVAHELTHALDDQYVSLDSLISARDRTQDGEFVVSALVEGSATAIMTQFMAQAQLSGQLKPEDLQGLMESEMERSRVFFEAPRYFQTLLANYTCGMNFLLEGNLSSLMGAAGESKVGENFLRATAELPRSSEQILHPEKYWNPKRSDEPVRVDSLSVGALLAANGATLLGTNTAGEIVIAAVTTPPDETLSPLASGLPTYWTNAAATGWGGDLFALVETEASPSKPAGIWITLWDTPADRDEFRQAYAEIATAKAATEVLLGTRGVSYLFGFDAEVAAAIRKGMEAGGLRFTRRLQAWSPDEAATR